MRKFVAISAACTALVFVQPAFAAEVDNQDQEDHMITTYTGEGPPVEMLLKAGKKAKVCAEACTILIDKSKNWDASETEEDQYVIRGGKLDRQPRG